jgi:hypothetical protein
MQTWWVLLGRRAQRQDWSCCGLQHLHPYGAADDTAAAAVLLFPCCTDQCTMWARCWMARSLIPAGIVISLSLSSLVKVSCSCRLGCLLTSRLGKHLTFRGRLRLCIEGHHHQEQPQQAPGVLLSAFSHCCKSQHIEACLGCNTVHGTVKLFWIVKQRFCLEAADVAAVAGPCLLECRIQARSSKAGTQVWPR